MNPITAICLLLLLPSLSAAIIGGDTVYRVVDGDSLLLISAKQGVEMKDVVRENSLDLTKLLKPGQDLRMNTGKIPPRTMENGIVVDIPGRMLYYFKAGRLELSFPVGLGMAQRQGFRWWHTPAASFTVTGKEKNPVWYVPESIQEKMKLQGKTVLTMVPPGKDNPLGRFVLYTSVKGIAIHETIWPTTVYRFRSHGCIRVLAQNIEKLYDAVDTGAPGELVYEPVKAVVTAEGKIFLEVDPDVYGKVKSLLDEATSRINALNVTAEVDWDKVRSAVRDQTGNAVDVTLFPAPAVSAPATSR